MESQVGMGLRSPSGGIQVLGAAWRWPGGRKETSQAGEEAPARPLLIFSFLRFCQLNDLKS